MNRFIGVCDATRGAPASDLSVNHLTVTQAPSGMVQKRQVIISCYEDGVPPVGFNWANTLVTQFPSSEYTLTCLLHGYCLSYALNDAAYNEFFGTINPQLSLLQTLNETYGVTMKVCELCLTENGYNNSQLASFMVPVPYSIQYLIQSQLTCNSIVIYDSFVLSSL